MVSGSVSGRMELGDIRILYRSAMRFTPFKTGCDLLNLEQIEIILDQWLTESRTDANAILAGGVIITGLAARGGNAPQLAALVESRLGEVLIAAAYDPGLESWLAFMGSCGALSRSRPGCLCLNMDIGGGTTNTALGLNGEVLRTGCHLLGARHVRLVPQTRQIEALTPEAHHLFAEFGIAKNVGEVLREDEITRFIAFQVQALERLACGDLNFFSGPFSCLEQLPFHFPALPPLLATTTEPLILFSGGVGELVYQAVNGVPLPPAGAFGDLGVDLAAGILRSPVLSRHLRTAEPENGGRATVYGLALHSTEVSGATLHMPRPDTLPLRHLPVVAGLTLTDTPETVLSALMLALRQPKGACLQVDFSALSPTDPALPGHLKHFGSLLAEGLRVLRPDPALPLVLLLNGNAGKTLGAYASDWGRLPVNLLVIDEVRIRRADFVNMGRPHSGVVPVAFYGIR